jgi:hypothetical protein
MAKPKNKKDEKDTKNGQDGAANPGDGENQGNDAEVKVEPEKTEVQKVEKGEIKYPLKVFIPLSGKKADQMAGFAHHAKKKKLGPMTIPQWREAFERFQNEPMR